MQRHMVCLHSTEDELCPLCLDSMQGRAVFIAACGHAWHLSCQRHWRARQRYRTCCMCRASLDESPSEPVDDFDVFEALERLLTIMRRV